MTVEFFSICTRKIERLSCIISIASSSRSNKFFIILNALKLVAISAWFGVNTFLRNSKLSNKTSSALVYKSNFSISDTSPDSPASAKSLKATPTLCIAVAVEACSCPIEF